MSISIVISVASAVVAAVSALYTARGFLQSKKAATQEIIQFLINQKNEYLSTYAMITERLDKDSLGSEETVVIDYLLSEATSNYCNAFECACSLYNRNAINKRIFKEMFKDEIQSIMHGEGIAAVLKTPIITTEGNVYSAIRKVAKEWGIE